MHVGIDYRIAQGKPCGMARYTTNLVKALARLDQENRYTIFAHMSQGRAPLDLPENFRWVDCPPRLFSVAEQLQLPSILASQKLDVFHSLSFSMPLWRNCRSIMTIYDLIHLIYPQKDSAKVALYYKTMVSWCLRNTDYVVTISENSRRDIEKALSVPPAKIEVIYGASDDVFVPMDREEAFAAARALGIRDRFVLYVGNMRKHKNILTLIKAFAALAGDYPALRLVLCGEKNHSYPNLVEAIKARGLTAKVQFLEGVSDTELRGLYCAAEALVLPSFYEGFGLPPLEAMACGVPVIVANTSSLGEIAGEGAFSFEPSDVGRLEHYLRQIMEDPAVRQEMGRRSLRRAKDFSWDTAALRALDLYCRVAHAKRPVALHDNGNRAARWRESRLAQLSGFGLENLSTGGVGHLRFHPTGETPRFSVIIPTLDGDRNGNLSRLLEDLCAQDFDSFEILIVKAVKPQGKAINAGADRSTAPFLVILDDDSRVPNADTFSRLYAVVNNGGHIGMAGASVVISPQSNRFQQRAARQFPRFNMPVVDQLTESDMASHGCCAIPRAVFYDVGKEKENILRGLDPDLRERMRRAGYKTVLVPNTWVYHPLSPTLPKLIKQFYRNGIGSAHAWIADPKTVFQTHEKADMKGFVPRRNFGYRVLRFPLRLVHSLLTLRFIRCMAYSGYALGFVHGLAKYSLTKKDIAS